MTKWRFSLNGGDPIFFAGIWDRFNNADPDNVGPMDTFAGVTHGAGAGVDAYHDRAPVVLMPDTWADLTPPTTARSICFRWTAPRTPMP